MDLRRTLVTASTSYASAISQVATGLISIRLATHNLAAEEFGAWSFIFSTLGYLFLLDFGISSAAARMLGEPMARRDNTAASQWVSMAVLIMIGQALLILAAGLALRDWILAFSGVQGRLLEELKSLWNILLIIRVVSHPAAVLAAVLFAQNRVHYQNVVFAISGWVQVAAFYLGLEVWHWGLLSYALSMAAGSLFIALGWGVAVFTGPVRLRLVVGGLPWAAFRKTMGYSTSVFAVQLSMQATLLTQSVIITGILGLEALAVFAVTSRLAVFSASFIGRPFAAFSPRWQHMQCEDDGPQRWRGEFIIMTRFTACFAAVAAIGILLVNLPFVRWWTKPEFAAVPLVTVLLAVNLWMQPVLACPTTVFHNYFKLSGFAIARVIAAVLEIGGAIVLARIFGLAGVPAASVVASALLFVFTFRHAGKIVQWPLLRLFLKDIAWWVPPFGVAAALCLWDLPSTLIVRPFGAFALSAVIGSVIALPPAFAAYRLLRGIKNQDKDASAPA